MKRTSAEADARLEETVAKVSAEASVNLKEAVAEANIKWEKKFTEVTNDLRNQIQDLQERLTILEVKVEDLSKLVMGKSQSEIQEIIDEKGENTFRGAMVNGNHSVLHQLINIFNLIKDSSKDSLEPSLKKEVSQLTLDSYNFSYSVFELAFLVSDLMDVDLVFKLIEMSQEEIKMFSMKYLDVSGRNLEQELYEQIKQFEEEQAMAT